MGKAKRAEKKARKKDKDLEAEMRAEMERAQRKRRLILAAVPLVTLAAAAGLYWGAGEESVAGAVLLGGAVVWLMMGLGFLGSAVKPRDRHRAGSIDFGNRR